MCCIAFVCIVERDICVVAGSSAMYIVHFLRLRYSRAYSQPDGKTRAIPSFLGFAWSYSVRRGGPRSKGRGSAVLSLKGKVGKTITLW